LIFRLKGICNSFPTKYPKPKDKDISNTSKTKNKIPVCSSLIKALAIENVKLLKHL